MHKVPEIRPLDRDWLLYRSHIENVAWPSLQSLFSC